MNKLAVILLLIAITLLSIAWTKENNKSLHVKAIGNDEPIIIDNNGKSSKDQVINIPIQLFSKDRKEIKYLQIRENSSLEEKIQDILNAISKEHFNELAMKGTVDGGSIAKIELLESDNKKDIVSWEEDYLNDYVKEYTINTIVKNVLQEEYNGPWIREVQLYYEDELIILD